MNRQVAELQVYERRNAEFKVEMAALEKQLDTLKTIVPEEKEVDEFMRLLQEAASASGVQIRSLTSQAVVPRDYHYELPFQISVDGPVLQHRGFLFPAEPAVPNHQCGRPDVYAALADPTKAKFPVRPGTTVPGTCTVTTFFSKPMDASPAPAGKNQPAKK